MQQNSPKSQWAPSDPCALWATSCFYAHHPSSCRVSQPLDSWVLPSSSLCILSFLFRALHFLLPSPNLSPHTHSLIHSFIPIYRVAAMYQSSRCWSDSRKQNKARTRMSFTFYSERHAAKNLHIINILLSGERCCEEKKKKTEIG